MKQSVSERLKELGLDLEFLAWLEGEEQRLPDMERVRDVKDADFAAAIRAAAWLAQLFADEKEISPHTPEQWLARYELLEQYLFGALQSTLFYHATSTAEDLASLEKVLETLLPPSLLEEYQKDILQLRRQGLPPDLPGVKPKPTGGAKESEQTRRMRAAVYYVSRRSKTPFADLARFWNERLGVARYAPELLKDRLRKGQVLSRTEGAGQRSLQFWRSVYRGDLRAVYPGPFPLSPKLRERYRLNAD